MMSQLVKFPLAQLELYTLFVYYGVKDAYLVDCCCMNADEATAFTSYLQGKYTLTRGSIITVFLDFDILFVNRESLCRKILDLEQKQNIPVVIDTGAVLSLLTDSSAQMEYIYSLFKDITSKGTSAVEFIVPVSESLHAVVGLPFVAGWLLGYPCLYRAHNSTADAGMTEDSNMINLVKYSISVDVCLKPVSANKKKGRNGVTAAKGNTSTSSKSRDTHIVEVMGFSIPERLFESNDSTCAQLQRSVDGIVEDMQRHADLIRNTNYLSVGKFTVTQSVHTVPKIAL